MPGSGAIRRFPNALSGRDALLVGRGRLAVDYDALPSSVRAGIRATFGADLSAEQVVQRVVDDVRTRGDAAVRQYSRAFDRVELEQLRVPEARIDAAVERIGGRVVEALERAAGRIRAFHEHGRRRSWLDHTPTG